MRFFLLLGVFLLIVWALRGGRRSSKPADPTDPAAEPSANAPAAAPADSADARPVRENIVACAHCGVHLPQSEAVPAEALWFCGQPHRVAHEKATPK